jgi:hypothetical protein
LWHIAFESVEKTRAWYDSPAYQELVTVRKKVWRNNFIAEGVSNWKFRQPENVSKQGDEP